MTLKEFMEKITNGLSVYEKEHYGELFGEPLQYDGTLEELINEYNLKRFEDIKKETYNKFHNKTKDEWK